MNQLFLFNEHSGDNSTLIPHFPIALDAGGSSFRQRGAFVKDKVQDGRVLIREWQEMEHRFDVCRVTNGAHIEYFWACSIHLYNYSFITTGIYNSVHHPCEYDQLPNRSNHLDTPCSSVNSR
jgi:hypothetical protein